MGENNENRKSRGQSKMTYNVTIRDGGVNAYQTIEAADLEFAVDAIGNELLNDELRYSTPDERRTEWDGTITDGVAVYRLYRSGTASTEWVKVEIKRSAE
jgi:hypothetical protein